MSALFSVLDGGIRYESPSVVVGEMEVGQVLCGSGDGSTNDDFNVNKDWVLG